MNFNDWFYYDETSPSGIRWKVDRWSGKNYQVLRVAKGAVAGSINAKGYWQVILQKKSYIVHRVIWEMVKGTLSDGEQVDHIDQNKQNNLLSNIRVVSNTVNKRNSGMYSNNKTGITGVRWITMDGTLYATATWATLEHIRKAAYFSVAKFGLLPAFKMAFIRRQEEIESLNKQGAEYSKIHGK
jgi:hypothetical protein